MNRDLISWAAFLFALLSFLSCSDDKAFTIGENLADIKGDVILVDTASINTYSIKADSILTSGFNKSLVGRYSDGILGKITASSCFQISLPNVTSLDEKARFDSVCVVLKSTGYCYGDSTKPVTVEVHKLIDDLENDEVTAWYNTSDIKYDPDVLGSKTSVLRPHSGKYLYVKLSETFGQELFNIILNGGDEIESQSNFSKYLKGFALTPDDLSESSIMQFTAVDSIAIMRIYYHVDRENYNVDFNIYNTSVQYNKIDTDYGDSQLKALKTKEDLMPSFTTDNRTYCQAGTGIMTKIEFPYIKNLFETYSTYKILKAELVIKPVRSSYNLIPLPQNISLYYTNTINDFGSVLSDSQGNALYPTLIYDEMYHQTAYYFDLTSYMMSVVNNLKDDAPALILSINDATRGNSLERLILGNLNHPSDAIQIKITYWKY